MIHDFREKLGGDARAAAEGSDLGVFEDHVEGIFGRWSGRSRSRLAGSGLRLGREVKSSASGRVYASFAGEVNGDVGAGRGILRVIGPGVGGAFTGDIHGFESHGRIVEAIKTLRPFLADEHAPGQRVGAVSEEQDRVMR